MSHVPLGLGKQWLPYYSSKRAHLWSQRFIRYPTTSGLDAHRLQQDPLGPPAVEFAVVNALPRAEIELAVRNRHKHLVAEQHALEVRVGIVLTGAMMAVVEPLRCDFFEPLHNVVPQTRLVIVDEDARSDVHGAYQDEPIP